MRFPDDLLETAKYLLRRPTKTLTDADIRRSVSTAYYALFHRLIEDAVAQLVPDANQRHALSRTFAHTTMREVCELAIKEPIPPLVVPFLGARAPDDLRLVALQFMELQEWRHDADYNLGRSITRADGRDRVADTQKAFEAWNRLPTSVTRPFLILLLIGKRSLR